MSRQELARPQSRFSRKVAHNNTNHKQTKRFGLALTLAGLVALTACEEGVNLPFLTPKAGTESSSGVNNATKIVERDVEAPDVFQVTEAGLWDGRPSIGGVWVAHPEVSEPERVIIRNNANGKFVIGALFRRERAIPGPRLQVSSDAASALSMLAGAPVELNVTALRKEVIDTAVPDSADANGDEDSLAAADSAPVAGASAIDSQPLDPIAGAAAAIDAPTPTAPTPTAQTTKAPTPAAAAPVAQPQAVPSTQRAALDKPYIQIGIFSVEANAKRTADQMRNAGIIPTVYEQSANAKPFWRVVVGPAKSRSERSQLLKSVKDAGFSDAYAVSN